MSRADGRPHGAYQWLTFRASRVSPWARCRLVARRGFVSPLRSRAVGVYVMNADQLDDDAYAAVRAARSPEMTRRISAHESGHALCAVGLGSLVEFVTIIPHDGFAGRCVRRGAPSTSLNLLGEQT